MSFEFESIPVHRQNGGKRWRPQPKRGTSLDNELTRSIDDEPSEEILVANGNLNQEIENFSVQYYRTSSSMSDNDSQLIGVATGDSFRFSSEEINQFRQESVDNDNLPGRSTRATTPGDEQIFQEPVESLQIRIGRLLSCEEMADMHFLVGSGPQILTSHLSSSQNNLQAIPFRKLRIPAHRLIMATASPVFKQLLFNSSTNQLVNCNEDIEINDIEPSSFLEFLRYSYTDSARLNKDNVVGVLTAAKRYQLSSLERQCVEHIHKCLSKKSCLAIWLTARAYGERDLENVARKSVQHYAETVLLSNDFTRADLSSVCELLADDLLRANEIVVFRALTRWAKQACLRAAVCPTRANVRGIIGSALNLVRFPLMSEEQLQRMVAAEGILDDELLRALVHCSRNWSRVTNMITTSVSSITFSNEPRAFQKLIGRLHNVYRFASFDNSLPNRYVSRSLNFLTNKRIWIAGIGLYAPRKACTFYLNVWARVRRSGQESKAWNSPLDQVEQTVLLKYDGSGHIINVQFDEPLQVEANVQYEVNASITPTTRSTSIVRARLHPHLYYTRPNEVNFYYGTDGQYATKVRVNNRSENVIFNFNWERDCNSVQEDSMSDSTSNNFIIPTASSEPTTPNPPPRPPPPQEYRRPSRMQRLRRALSFIDRREDALNNARESGLLEGQIPVLMFYA